MCGSAYLLKASLTRVVKLLNFCQFNRWEMAFQCSLTCIKASHMCQTHLQIHSLGHVLGHFKQSQWTGSWVWPNSWVIGSCGFLSCLGGSGVYTANWLLGPPLWFLKVTTLLWAPTGQGSNCFLNTKKTLSEEDDLVSEKCSSPDLLHSPEGHSGLRTDRGRTMGYKDWNGTVVGGICVWRHKAFCLSRITDTASCLPLSLKAHYPFSPTCLPE